MEEMRATDENDEAYKKSLQKQTASKLRKKSKE